MLLGLAGGGSQNTLDTLVVMNDRERRTVLSQALERATARVSASGSWASSRAAAPSSSQS